MGFAHEDFSTHKSPYALPPPEAWRDPDIWLETDGLTIRHDAPKFMPELNSDGVVKPLETTEKVLSLFQNNYTWPVNRRHPELIVDVHHFQHDGEKYKPMYHNGSTLPMRFRGLAILKGSIPRTTHMVAHGVLLEPDMPDYDVMQEYCDHYYHLTDLHESASNTLEARRLFAVRRADIARNPERIGNRTEDTVGKYVLSLIHERHYTNYQQRITEHQERETPPLLFDYVNYDMLEAKKPHVVRRALRPLGQIAANKTINLLPIIPTRAA